MPLFSGDIKAVCVEGGGADINLRAPPLNTPLFSGEIMALCVGGGPDINLRAPPPPLEYAPV